MGVLSLLPIGFGAALLYLFFRESIGLGIFLSIVLGYFIFKPIFFGIETIQAAYAVFRAGRAKRKRLS
jgi:hypothetical protein